MVQNVVLNVLWIRLNRPLSYLLYFSYNYYYLYSLINCVETRWYSKCCCAMLD